jgi:aminoglycoside phosphotransferase (APT) family kinase protein
VSESAVKAAVGVAAEHGLRADDPVVLRDAWHVLVHLRPLPLVARVSSGRRYPEGPPEEDVVRELAVASHAARAGAPVVPPSDLLEPGPHRRDGHVVAFWQYVEPRGEVDPQAAGRALRAVHDALADYEGDLPELHADDLAGILDSLEPSADVDLLRELGARRPSGPRQAVHGDAHLGNCLQGPDGPLWHDFETTCLGPREFDLAALVPSSGWDRDEASLEAIGAYGDHDVHLVQECVPVYEAWICASLLAALPRRPELGQLVDDELRWLRANFA